MKPSRALLLDLYDTAVRAAHPSLCLPPHLPPSPAAGRLLVLAVGKAAAAMAQVCATHYAKLNAEGRLLGLVTAPYGYVERLAGGPPSGFQVIEARHPTPDEGSLVAADRALALAASAAPGDTVLVLLSGGASALWAAPTHGLELAEKTALTRGLLKCGADIYEMNTVRRHLSRIKGGRLAAAAGSAHVVTLAISDVPGDDPATIGSGPTVPDATTLKDAREVLDRRAPRMVELGLPIPAAVHAVLADLVNETPKPGTERNQSHYEIIATPQAALDAAAALAHGQGYRVVDLGGNVTGEAREVAAAHARLALEARARGERIAILSGGELEVTVRNRRGRGGRSQEYALALALALDGTPGICGIAADTDGIDGGDGHVDDPAGALALPDTLARARARHSDAQKFLDDNDATSFFEPLGDLVVRGPSHTNVNDFRAILVDRG